MENRQNTKITKIINDRGDITTEYVKIKQIIREDHEHLHANKLDR